LRSALDQLDLNDDQKQQISDLLTQMQPKLQQIRRDRQAGIAVQGQVQTILADFRSSLATILTTEQREKLRQQLRGEGPSSTRPAEVASNTMSTMVDQPDAGESAHAQTPAANPIERAAQSASVGTDAPPFKLLTAGGAAVPLSNFKNRVLIIEFGSISSPTFRDHVADMAKLAQNYTGRAFFLMVYTHEAFPAGGRESAQNQEDGISVTEPTDLRARQTLAEQAHSTLHVNIPIVVDTMDNATSTAYGGYPNGTVIIGRDGKIAARQQWTDPSGLSRLIDLALAAK
jgi:Iodothyronine deiodinase